MSPVTSFTLSNAATMWLPVQAATAPALPDIQLVTIQKTELISHHENNIAMCMPSRVSTLQVLHVKVCRCRLLLLPL